MSFNLSFSFGFVTATRRSLTTVSADATTPANTSIRVRVYPRWYKYAAVEWTVPATWGDCIFNVYHSTTSEGNYTRINPSPVRGNSLIDYSTQDYSEFRNGWYIVEAVLNGGSGPSMRSPAATYQNVQRRWVEIRSDEIQRRELILLHKFTGVRSFLFKRRTYGQRCTYCWNPVSETVTNDRCTLCYGTSFLGGYFPPQPLFIQYDATPNQVQKTYSGLSEPNAIGAWTISFPEVASDDIIVRIGDWNIYRVSSIQTTELQTNPVRQILRLDQLNRHEIENYLVTTGLADFPKEFASINRPT